jgi:hypothetical protein
MNTAKDAINCKASASRGGKTPETDIKSMPSKCQVPILNKVYYSRIMGIRHAFQSYRQACGIAGVTSVQILVLGGGYDTSFNDCGYNVFLVDYEEVIESRRSRGVDVSSPHVTLVTGDLCQPEQLLTDLISNKFSPLTHTFVVLESVLAYVNLTSAQSLLRSLTANIRHLCGVIYDPILPTGSSSPLARCAVGLQQTFASRHVPLLSAQGCVQDMCVFLRRCGMRHVQSIDMRGVMEVVAAASSSTGTIGNTTSQRQEASEPFDEFAALAVLHRLYALSYFSSGSTDSLLFDSMVKYFFNSSASVAASPQQSERKEASLNQCQATRLRTLEQRLLSFEAVNPTLSSAARCCRWRLTSRPKL